MNVFDCKIQVTMRIDRCDSFQVQQMACLTDGFLFTITRPLQIGTSLVTEETNTPVVKFLTIEREKLLEEFTMRISDESSSFIGVLISIQMIFRYVPHPAVQ